MLLTILANKLNSKPSVQASVSNEIIERVSEIKSGLSKSALLLVLTSTFVAGTQPQGVHAASFAEAEPFVKEQRAHLNGALFVSSSYNAALDIPVNARRHQETYEPELFVKEQRASLPVAQAVSYYTASDLTPFARRKAECFDGEVFAKEQRGHLNGAYFVPSYVPGTDVLIWARRNQACYEPEGFEKAQRASLVIAQQVTYYTATDLGIQVRRRQETFEPETFVKERRPHVNLELYGQFSASADLTAYFRRNQTVWEPDSFIREQRANISVAYQVPAPFVAASDLAIFFRRAQGTWDSELFPQAVPVAQQLLINGTAAPFVPVIVPVQVPAGRKLRYRDIYRVTIDGQTFECRSLADALTLLERAKKLAQDIARENARQAMQAKPDPRAPALMPVPQITASSRELRGAVTETKREIAETYRQALIDAEIAMLLELDDRTKHNEDVLWLLM